MFLQTQATLATRHPVGTVDRVSNTGHWEGSIVPVLLDILECFAKVTYLFLQNLQYLQLDQFKTER